MAKINAEMNVKTSSGYDQLHLTSDASLVEYSTDRTGANAISEVKGALDYLMSGTFPILTDQDVLAYFVSTQKDNTTITVRGLNNPSPPTGQSPITNELYYISFRIDLTYISVVAVDARSNNIYSNIRNNGTWGGWVNLSNAKTLDGISRTGFMQNYPHGTGLTLTSATHTQPYTANISSAQATSIGLPANAWHLMYLPHTSAGNGCQIAYPLDSATQKPKYRIALGTTWQAWKSMGGSGAVISATAPADTESLWIDSAGLMKYHNGTTWVAVKTNAVWG